MDYTLSLDYATHAGTGNRMHEENAAVTTMVSEKDMNSLIWSLMEIIKAAGLAGVQFDEAIPATYQQLLAAVNIVAANAPITDVISAIKYRHIGVSGCAGFLEI